MPRRHVIGAALAALALGPLATAQYVNRAVWLGLDEEGVRRDFAQGTEYFLDRFSYVVRAPWWDRGLPRFGNAFTLAVGSTSSSQFTIESQFDHALPLGEGFTFRYHFQQSEHRDTRFVRNEIALERTVGEHAAVFVQASPLAEKSGIDVSVGAFLWRTDESALRVMLTAVDAPNEKSGEVEYLDQPFGAMVSGVFGDPDAARLYVEAGAQLPFTLRRLDDGSRLRLWRTIALAEAHVRTFERDWLVAGGECEWTAKDFQPLAVGDPLREDLDRRFRQVRLEWWRDVEIPWSIGVVHTRHVEAGRRPNDPAADLVTSREETLAIARMHVPLGERWSFEPQAFAGRVRDFTRDAARSRDHDRFEGKLSLHARYDFSPNVSLAVQVGVQLDELAFGGGGAVFVARF